MPYKIEVTLGDITKVDTQAIVNAANNELWMGSGVAGAIKAAGGEVIEEEAMNKGSVMPGDAIFTGAGKLPYRYVIHAAVMGQNLKTTDKLIRTATLASLTIADRLKLESVAFPAFGTGVGGFPMSACAHLMVLMVRGFQGRAEYLKRVVFCMHDSLGYKLFSEKVSKKD